MGYYLNNAEVYTLYKEVAEDLYFVDKTAILKELIPLIDTPQKYVCLTRPRRFGKTVMANLIGAYFSKGCDAAELFDCLDIAKSAFYRKHLNQYNVIYIDFSEMNDECKSYASYINNIKELLREDLHAAYPEVVFRQRGSIWEDLKRIHTATGNKFVFVLDEWDAIFHMPFIKEKDKLSYLSFLKNMLKGKVYVSLAYMTGILPIAKYSSGSELNMFLEYTMSTKEKYSEYFGFLDEEVDILHERYLKQESVCNVSREGLREWYDGYQTLSGQRLYNPRSVVCALKDNQLSNYWTSSGPYDEIFYYIKKNVADVQEGLALMVSGEAIHARVEEYAATSMSLSTKDEIFSAMLVYGFLSYEKGKVRIPNKELMDKFRNMLRKENSQGYVFRLAKESDKMLRATLNGDTRTMAEILEYAHDTEIPLLSYNNETELTAVVNLVYLAARDFYRIEREDKAGIGYVDFIFYPNDTRADCIILELKVDHSAKEAIQQIKQKKYALRFKGKLGEESLYTGKILAVGISYDKETKKHSCIVEELNRE